MPEPEIDPRAWKDIITRTAPEFAIGLKPRRAPAVLYHYTGIDAFRSIVSGGEFWFTDVAYMNDAGEIDYAAELIREVVTKSASDAEIPAVGYWAHGALDRLAEVVTTYALSLSEEDDSLTQWRGYCRGGGGVALGLNCDAQRAGFSAGQEHALELIPIEYDRSVQETALRSVSDKHFELLQRLLTALVSSERPDFGVPFSEVFAYLLVFLRAAVQTTVARFKSWHWSSEREWRLTITSTPVRLGKQLRFRTGPVGLTPYISAPLRARSGPRSDRLPICEVIIGPGEHQELNATAVQQFLTSEGYAPPEIRIRLSDVPLRY